MIITSLIAALGRVARLAPAGGAATLLFLAAMQLAACGDSPKPKERGCVVVDVSPLPLHELTHAYVPGFERFISRVAQHGSGDVCFAFAARGLSGGAAAWGHFGCDNPADTLRCPPQVRASVNAAAAQLSSVAAGAGDLHGASQLVEAVALVAPATRPGDEILLLSDAVQNSGLTGDFTRHATRLDAAGIVNILDRLAARGMLPDLRGRRLRIPYALYRSDGPMNMGAARKLAVLAFWTAYAHRTGAELVFGGGDEAA